MDNIAIAPDYDPTEFAPLALLEQGDVDVWVRRRGAILMEKSKETAKDCEAGKLASAIAVGASVVMSSNPLAWIPLTIGAIGYVYTIFQEFQDTIGDKLRLSGSCQEDLRRGWKKNWSEPRCCSGKGATINLMKGFRCCLTIPKS